MAKSSQFYTNKDIKYLVNRRIVEWDIQRAGLQALCNMGIISEDTHEYWKSRDKHWSSIYVGKNLAAKMKDQNQFIVEAVDRFIVENGISDERIISRNRDAVFLFDSRITKTEFNHFHFVMKHRYTSYYHIDRFDFYYNGQTDELTVKGIDTRYVDNHPLIPYVKKCIRWYELLTQGVLKYKDVYTQIHKLRNEYCGMKLPLGCYREISFENPLAMHDKQTGLVTYFQTLPELEPERYELITQFNFTQIIVPFINILPSMRSKELRSHGSKKNQYGQRHGI